MTSTISEKGSVSIKRPKGQFILKELFAILEFFQKTNQISDHSTIRQKKRICLFVYWKNPWLKRNIMTLSDL